MQLELRLDALMQMSVVRPFEKSVKKAECTGLFWSAHPENELVIDGIIGLLLV